MVIEVKGQILWLLVLQITISRISKVIATWVLYSTTCPLALTRQYGEIAIEVLQSVGTFLAVTAVIMFERRMKPQLDEHKGTMKLVSYVLCFAKEQESHLN